MSQKFFQELVTSRKNYPGGNNGAGELGHVFSYNGTMFMAVQHTLGNDNPWLIEIFDPNPEVIEAEVTVVDTKKK
jgi:hypothetical protein